MTEPETKTCPFCAETIKAAAVKCRYCMEMLPAEPPPDVPENEPALSPNVGDGLPQAEPFVRRSERKPGPGEIDLKTAAPIILLAALIAVAYIVNAIKNPPPPSPRVRVTEVLPMTGSGDDRRANVRGSDGKVYSIPVDSSGRPR